MTPSPALENSASRGSPNGFRPILLAEVEWSRPQTISRLCERLVAENFQLAQVLVRQHSFPLGLVNFDTSIDVPDVDWLAKKIWASLSDRIMEHLQDDEIEPESYMHDRAGSQAVPHCQRVYHAALDAAPFVSVIVATRNRLPQLKLCISSLLSLNYPTYEVLIVDNAPESNEVGEYIASTFSQDTRVRYIVENNAGLAIAHNRALSETNASIVAFTDDDVIVDPEWLLSLVANFQQDFQVACVTGMILPLELDTPSQQWIEQFGGFSKGFERITYDLTHHRPSDGLFPYTAGRFGSGANMAFRTSALIAIGGFDPALGSGTPARGGDDLAAFFDVISHGYRLVYEPRAIVYHKHRPDYPSLVHQAFGYGVGLSAFFTRIVVERPSLCLDLFTKVSRGLNYLLNPRSRKNQHKQRDYPNELTQLELKGFLRGPVSYWQSRSRAKKLNVYLPKARLV